MAGFEVIIEGRKARSRASTSFRTRTSSRTRCGCTSRPLRSSGPAHLLSFSARPAGFSGPRRHLQQSRLRAGLVFGLEAERALQAHLGPRVGDAGRGRSPGVRKNPGLLVRHALRGLQLLSPLFQASPTCIESLRNTRARVRLGSKCLMSPAIPPRPKRHRATGREPRRIR